MEKDILTVALTIPVSVTQAQLRVVVLNLWNRQFNYHFRDNTNCHFELL